MRQKLIVTFFLILIRPNFALKCYECQGMAQCESRKWNITTCRKNVASCFSVVDLKAGGKCEEINTSLAFCTFCRGERCKICEKDLCNASTKHSPRNHLVLLAIFIICLSQFYEENDF
nr:PREDICTED: uncharacterized protein LOC107397735 isoform X2 [Tribolium castaneum]|eukprot:XP_015834437.1 PREDICTED: uncharacterized protein LOC107397735 isoform X2 [Tribolium castaneum]